MSQVGLAGVIFVEGSRFGWKFKHEPTGDDSLELQQFQITTP